MAQLDEANKEFKYGQRQEVEEDEEETLNKIDISRSFLNSIRFSQNGLA